MVRVASSFPREVQGHPVRAGLAASLFPSRQLLSGKRQRESLFKVEQHINKVRVSKLEIKMPAASSLSLTRSLRIRLIFFFLIQFCNCKNVVEMRIWQKTAGSVAQRGSRECLQRLGAYKSQRVSPNYSNRKAFNYVIRIPYLTQAHMYPEH